MEAREIIRQDDEVPCILPDRRVVLLEARKDLSPLVAALPSYSEDLDPHYELTLGDALVSRSARAGAQHQTARRVPLRLHAVARSSDRHAVAVAAHRREGEIVEQILFTDIEMLDSTPGAALEPTIDTTGFEACASEVDAVAVEIPWRASSLPGGFKLSVATQSPIAGSETPVEHLVYSDGLATVSVFIEDPNTKAEVAEGFSNVGSTNAFSLTLRGRKVTAVGEVPRRTVRTIASSLVAE